jgi:cytochrome c-type biogenesis protein CcmE
MTPKYKRLTIILGGLVILAGAVGLTLSALNDNIVFFYGPTELAEMHVTPDRSIRVGGLVEPGSVEHQGDGRTIHFTITDGKNTIPVVYTGLLPDLFREGQGVVAQGRVSGGEFQATEILAKHDENYMPPEVADALKKSGEWRPETGKMP